MNLNVLAAITEVPKYKFNKREKICVKIQNIFIC